MSTETTTWFDDRTWSVSGNKEDLLRIAKDQNNKQSSSTSVVFPKSTNEISELLAKNQHAKIAVVCGGHSSSNVAAWPIHNDSKEDVIILDMKEMASISVDKQTKQVTVAGGVLSRKLAETCKEEKGALPVGTGDTVGVCGYVLNSGISGYFGKRLGMLGQVSFALLCLYIICKISSLIIILPFLLLMLSSSHHAHLLYDMT
tara:strand:- start:67 stop:672 length:606 start_codon:yes stop_codon:yes gene_type:complete